MNGDNINIDAYLNFINKQLDEWRHSWPSKMLDFIELFERELPPSQQPRAT